MSSISKMAWAKGIADIYLNFVSLGSWRATPRRREEEKKKEENMTWL